MDRQNVAYNPSAIRSVAAGVYMGVMGGQVVIVQPGFVQGLVERAGFSEEQAGLIASIEMAGFAAMTILLICCVYRLDRGRPAWLHVD
jgi:hypothetical protein